MRIGHGILAIIKELCALGPRWMGREGAMNARNYIVEQFNIVGLKTELQSFSYLSYEPRYASIMIADRELQCEPIAYSTSTIQPLTAPLIYCGHCTEKEIASLKARGAKLNKSILLSDNLRSFVAYPIAEAAGALGFISLTSLQDNTIRCGCARNDRKLGNIPAVSIGGIDGREIVQRLKSEEIIEATIQLNGQIEEREGENVIGIKPGNSNSRILITAHYDSFWNGVHAMDNGAGTATIISLARSMLHESETAFEFVAFGGEELGFWGSTGYVERHRKSLSDIIAVINLDNFGSKLSQLEIGATADLLDFCRLTAEENKISIDCWNTPPRIASDQHVFVEEGVPAIWIANCGADPRYHTPLDVPAEMSTEKLEAVATLAFEFAKKLS